MEFTQVLTTRRSHRAFTSDAVTPQQIQELIQACTWAPSPLHLQPWSFVVISEPEVKASVRQVAEKAVKAVVSAGGPSWVEKYSCAFLEQAPVIIAVFSDPAKGGMGKYFNQPHGAMMGVAAGIQNLLLAATDQGLGSLWFTFFDPQDMAQALGAPPQLELAGLIPLGVPAAEVKTPPRKEPKVFQNRYGGR